MGINGQITKTGFIFEVAHICSLTLIMFSLNSLDLGLRFIVAFLCEIYIKLVISKHIVLLLLNIKYATSYTPRFMLYSP